MDSRQSKLIKRLLPLIPVVGGSMILIVGRGLDSMTLSIVGGLVCVAGLAIDMLI